MSIWAGSVFMLAIIIGSQSCVVQLNFLNISSGGQDGITPTTLTLSPPLEVGTYQCLNKQEPMPRFVAWILILIGIHEKDTNHSDKDAIISKRIEFPLEWLNFLIIKRKPRLLLLTFFDNNVNYRPYFFTFSMMYCINSPLNFNKTINYLNVKSCIYSLLTLFLQYRR
jgi:hypothetical protein